ncbi:alpha/beta hydrolase [Mesorhizobium sp. WSM4887]|uniref:alpha/beta fold hydrolase n=1 Tax=Mesorhizobium sp. WSM4887 TaxID=3038543 RepID=UPI002416DFC1|nr:alpha/beta hydrolase [Mesorhizobium sp. WSM4887]MDG4889842.1 alpha/beta hydrolase [Mesorhizobium sp. WSM4887]
MAKFVLVHGAWHGGWCYDLVARRLRSKGHEVYTPTLTGLGERSHLLDDKIDLNTHIQDVLNVIKWQDLDQIILCGHSYGGMIVTGVADAAPEKIANLVYLDAYVPKDGEAIWDYMGEERRRTLLRDAEPYNGQAIAAPPPAHFGVEPRNQAWVAGKMTPQPTLTLTQPIRLRGAYAADRRHVYVFATGPSSMQGFYPELKSDPAWEVKTMNCGHDQMVDAPDEVAEILIQAAESVKQ